MAKHNFNYDLIVIGSGAGGSAAASITARSGKSVALIETDTFGGTSANFSDVPTKALLHAAKLYDHAKHGQKFGIRSGAVGYNYPSIKAWKDTVVKRTGAGANQRYYQSQGINLYNGLAHLISPHEVSVNRRHISAEYILVATGATWQIPAKIHGFEKIEYLTPHSALELIRPPKSLFIIGGGSTGLELAQLFSSFGSKVYVADIAPRLLPSEDTEVSDLIESYLNEHKGITALTQARVTKVSKEGLLKRVTYTSRKVEKSVKVDEILIAAGKNPMVDIGLENAGVEYTPKGIEVNENLQTTSKHIYAAGDVLGTHMYTHVALLESRIAAHNIFNRNKITPNYTAIPRITYTDPEVASTGLSEDDCIKRDLPINQAIAPLSITARANIEDVREGFAKIITDKKGIILGGTVVAPNAGEIIHEITVAVQNGLHAREVANTIHAFPSWSEVVRVTASKLA